ncbi:MAG: TrkH family potassium uptake protein [Salinigranum sp.]
MGSWYRAVGEDLSQVLRGFAGAMVSLVVVAFAWGEYYVLPGVVLSIGVVLGLGVAIGVWSRGEDHPSRAQTFASAALVWLVVGALSGLPFLLVAWSLALAPSLPFVQVHALTPTMRVFLHPIDAAYEGLSGITGTGLTMTLREQALPATLQWWRSLTEWLGGIGVIVLTIAVVRDSESMLTQYYEDQSPLGEFDAGDVSNAPRLIFGLFVALTLLSIGVLWAAGMPLWAAINHGMTAVSTGGFSVTDRSMAAYGAVVRLALVPVMLAGAVPFPVYYFLLKGRFGNVYSDVQTRWLLALGVVGSLLVAGTLWLRGTYPSGFRDLAAATFQFVSAITCTGLSTAPALGGWPPDALLTLVVAMTIGGASASTASGVKLIRLISLERGIRNRVRDPFPDEELSSLDEQVSIAYASDNYHKASIVVFLWLLFFAAGVGALLLVLPPGTHDVSVRSVMFEVASAQSNVGLSSGIGGPWMPAAAKAVLMVNMWVGRLELIPILVFFRLLLWRAESLDERLVSSGKSE